MHFSTTDAQPQYAHLHNGFDGRVSDLKSQKLCMGSVTLFYCHRLEFLFCAHFNRSPETLAWELSLSWGEKVEKPSGLSVPAWSCLSSCLTLEVSL